MVKDDVEKPGRPGYRSTLALPSLPPAAERRVYVHHGRFSGLYDIDKRTMRILNRVHLSMEVYAMPYLAAGYGLRIRRDMVAAYAPGAEEQSQYE